MRQLATLLGTKRSWPPAGPSSLSESLLALSRIGFGCFTVSFIACIGVYLHLCLHLCLHSSYFHLCWLVVYFSVGWELHEVKGPIPRLWVKSRTPRNRVIHGKRVVLRHLVEHWYHEQFRLWWGIIVTYFGCVYDDILWKGYLCCVSLDLTLA